MVSGKHKLFTLIVLVFFVLSSISIPSSSVMASSYSTVQWNGLFSDQGPQYFSPQSPGPNDPETVTLRATNNNLTSVNVIVYDTTSSTSTIAMTRAGSDANGYYEFWTAQIPASSSTKYYYFQANAGTSIAYYNGYGTSSTVPNNGNFWITPGFTTPSWAQNGIMYQIFVDRFNNGNSANDVTNGEYTWSGNSTFKLQWGQDPELGDLGGADQVAFAGGDLQGVDQKLPYLLNSLGANILYLNPIFTADTNHKYDTKDYSEVDPHFGGNSALAQLTTDVHNSKDNNGNTGRIILDGVFNHTSNTNNWFTDAQTNGKLNPYYNWYTYTNWPNSYASFYGILNLPKLNYEDNGLRNEIYGAVNSVAQTYLSSPYNIDGWRLDAPGHVGSNGYDPEANGNYNDPTNHLVWQGFRQAVKSVNPNALIFGEWFEDSQPSQWLGGNEWDGSVNYNGFLQPASEWITGYDDSFNSNSINVTTLDQWLHNTLNSVTRSAQLAQVNQLSTHDVSRFGERDALSINYKNYGPFTEKYGGTPNYWKDYLGAFLQFTFEGIPTIYYGDEYGMMGGGINDPGKRWSFDWNKVSNGGNDVFKLYQKLIKLRKQSSALVDGSFMTLLTDNTKNMYSFSRFDQNSNMTVILNNSDTTQIETINVAQSGITNGTTLQNVTPLVNGVTQPTSFTSDSNGNITVTLNGHYGMILEAPGTPN